MAPGPGLRHNSARTQKDSAHRMAWLGCFGRVWGNQATSEGKRNRSFVCLSSCDSRCAPFGEEQRSGIMVRMCEVGMPRM